MWGKSLFFTFCRENREREREKERAMKKYIIFDLFNIAGYY